jgi:hypothetical protein
MHGRRQQSTIVRGRETSSAPLILGVMLLVIAGGGFVWFALRDDDTPPAPPQVVTVEPPQVAVAEPPRVAVVEPPPVAAVEPPPVAATEPPPLPIQRPTAAPEPSLVRPTAPTAPVEPARSVEATPPPASAPLQTAVLPVAIAPVEHPKVAEARRALAAGDHQAALELLTLQVEQGVAAAEALLGLMHAKGTGVAADAGRAFALFTKAAAQGNADGQFHLGQAYHDGFGTKADMVRALAWFMHAAARGQNEAVAERDRLLATLDDTAKVQADSLTRNLPVPMPAGWIADAASGVRVWSPSWYRNGTFKLRIEGGSANGGVDGPAKVMLTATLYGRSDRTFEGTFAAGLMLDARLREQGQALQLLESDEIRMALRPEGPAIHRLWRQTKLDGMQIEACPKATQHLYAVMAPEFTGIEDAQVKAAAVAAAQALAALCPPQAHQVVQLALLPPEHREVYERGATTYTPRLAEVQLYGLEQAQESWSISIKNHAREAHARREHEAEQQRKKLEREQKQAREVAAAMTRGMPNIRGFKLGLTFDQFRAAIGADAKTWEPKLKDDFKLPAYNSFQQKVTLNDGTSFVGTFSSAQNGSQMIVLSYEQHLRDGPDAAELRQQLYTKYGQPDDEAGGNTWLTWWLRSAADGEPKGALLRGRIETDQAKRANTLRLTIADNNLARRDEMQGAQARRQAERDAFEQKKSDKPKF